MKKPRKNSSLNIRFSTETADKLRDLCADFKTRHGIEITLSNYLRSIVEREVQKEHTALKSG